MASLVSTEYLRKKTKEKKQNLKQKINMGSFQQPSLPISGQAQQHSSLLELPTSTLSTLFSMYHVSWTRFHYLQPRVQPTLTTQRKPMR